MKFQPDRPESGNFITRCEPPGIWVGSHCWAESVVVPWAGDPSAWAVQDWNDLSAPHFDAVVALSPELVILGSGAKHRFIQPRHIHRLIGAGIGVECMDTMAGCRTFNVLVSEGRRVVAALLPPGAI